MRSVKKTFITVCLAGLLVAGVVFHREVKWQILLAIPSAESTPLPADKPPVCDRCNLILVSLDTVRADKMGFLGAATGLTPNLDGIAKKALVFDNAFTNAFFTTPSHMTVFTSLYPSTHRVEATEVKVPRLTKTEGPAIPLAGRFKTIAQVLQSEKYQTVWAAPLKFKFFAFGDGFGRGFEKTLPSPFKRGLRFPLGSEMILDAGVMDQATGGGKKQPMFLFLHSYVTHLPYVFGEDYPDKKSIPYRPARLLEGIEPIFRKNPKSLIAKYEDPGFNQDKAYRACTNFENMSECFRDYTSPDNFVHRLGQWQLRTASNVIIDSSSVAGRREELGQYVKAYDFGVKSMDRQVGQLWSYLEGKGLLKNSVVIFFSDHGEELFDHGQGNHSSFYEHTARVPLIIYAPGQQAAADHRLVSLVDLMPTILEMLNLKSRPEQMQGKSIFEKEISRDYVYGYSLGVTYVRGRGWKLIQTEKGEIELYNLLLDPREKENLAKLRLPAVRRKIEELSDVIANFKLSQAL